MKLFLVIICIFTSLHSFAQQRDTVYISGKKLVMRDAANVGGKAYVEIDGKVYKGSLSSINLDSILKLVVIKAGDAKNVYGEKAKNGAILITTKSSTEVGDILLSSIDRSLNKDKVHNQDSVETGPNAKDSAMYVIDGELSSEKNLHKIDPDNILSIDVLKKSEVSDPSLSNVKSDVVAVITKYYAIKQYQNKFSAFSKEYVNYLKTQKGDDSRLKYVLDGRTLPEDNNSDIIKKLYAIPVSKIKKVSFIQKATKAEYLNGQPVLIITTKQN
jgi:hypothetical protein